MATKLEMCSMGVIPKEELELFKLTPDVEIPWVNPVTYWVPTRADIKAIGAFARSVSEQPTVVDIGCGNAFASHLLAEEIPVMGIDPNEELLVRTPYRHPNLKLKVGTAENAGKLLEGKQADVVINSWMPDRVNFSDDIYALNPKAVIFIRDAWGYTGTREAYAPQEGYRRVAMWGGIATGELSSIFGEICRGLEPRDPYKYYTVEQAKSHPRWEAVFKADNIRRAAERGIAACNIFDVRFREDIPDPKVPFEVDKFDPYQWETDLQYILASTYVSNKHDERPLYPPLVISLDPETGIEPNRE